MDFRQKFWTWWSWKRLLDSPHSGSVLPEFWHTHFFERSESIGRLFTKPLLNLSEARNPEFAFCLSMITTPTTNITRTMSEELSRNKKIARPLVLDVSGSMAGEPIEALGWESADC